MGGSHVDAGATATDGVIKLLTREEREEQARKLDAELAHEEAMSMLRRLLKAGDGHQFAGVVIAFAYADGSVGRLIPQHSANVPALIAAAGVAHHDLILKTITGAD